MRPTPVWCNSVHGIAFDHVTKNYIVHTTSKEEKIAHVQCFSETGELRNSLFLDIQYIRSYRNHRHLVSHPNGPTAFVNPDGVLYLHRGGTTPGGRDHTTPPPPPSPIIYENF